MYLWLDTIQFFFQFLFLQKWNKTLLLYLIIILWTLRLPLRSGMIRQDELNPVLNEQNGVSVKWGSKTGRGSGSLIFNNFFLFFFLFFFFCKPKLRFPTICISSESLLYLCILKNEMWWSSFVRHITANNLRHTLVKTVKYGMCTSS